MKKYILAAMLFFVMELSADIVDEQVAKMLSTVDKEYIVALSVNNYVEDRGAAPATITSLINSGHLPSTFTDDTGYGTSFTFSLVGFDSVEVNSHIAPGSISEIEKEYYLNYVAGALDGRDSYESAGVLKSRYNFTQKAIAALQTKMEYPAAFVGRTDPRAYATVGDGAIWYDGSYKDFLAKKWDVTNGLWSVLKESNQNLDPLGANVGNTPVTLSKSVWENTAVDIITDVDPIDCSPATYNAVLDRCEAYTATAAPTGYESWTYSPTVDKFYNPVVSYAPSGAWLSGSYFYKNATVGGGVTSYTATASTSSSCPSGTTLNAAANLCYDGGSWVCTIVDAKSTCSNKGMQLPPIGISSALLAGGIPDGGNWTWSSSGWGTKNTNYQKWKGNGTATIPITCIARCVVAPSSTTSYSCPSGGTLSGTTCTTNTTTYTCDSGWSAVNTTQCRKSVLDYKPAPAAYDSARQWFTVSPTCSGKVMPVAPFYPTPYYGNNGVCYSEAGLYCKTTGVSWDGVYTCFDNSLMRCTDTTKGVSVANDRCERFDYSCSGPANAYGHTKHLYGLTATKYNSNGTDLMNRITNKDDKLNAIVTTIVSGDYITNDNEGAMCSRIDFSTLPQTSPAPTYDLNGQNASGF